MAVRWRLQGLKPLWPQTTSYHVEQHTVGLSHTPFNCLAGIGKWLALRFDVVSKHEVYGSSDKRLSEIINSQMSPKKQRTSYLAQNNHMDFGMRIRLEWYFCVISALTRDSIW